MKLNELNAATTPFRTDNFALALCLHQAGVPWANEISDSGASLVMPIWNCYDADILSKISRRREEIGLHGYKGMELEEAAKTALEDGEKGEFAYCFDRTERVELLIAAFYDQGRRMDDGTGTAAEMIGELSKEFGESAMPEDEYLCRVTAITLRTRKNLAAEWKNVVPKIRIRKNGTTVKTDDPEGGYRVRHPGFIIVDLNASAETRKHLGL